MPKALLLLFMSSLMIVSCATDPPKPAPPASMSVTAAATVAATPSTVIERTPLTPSPAPAITPMVTAAPAPPATVPVPRGAIHEIERGNLDRAEIAFTLDCGGHATGTAEILAVLRDAGVRITWFMIGDWVRAYPDLAREIAARHEIANHSNTHPDYRDLTDVQIAADLDAADRTFREVLGVSSKPLWRAPSGARDDRVLAAATHAGWLLHIFWTFGRDTSGNLVTGDSGDWRGFNAQQVAENIRRVTALRNGVITVSHCDSEATRASLPEVLRELREAGLRVTTVSDVLR